MNRRFLSLDAVAAALLAGGCNMVVSEQPLFAHDRAAAAAVRPGVWAMPDQGCAFDSQRRLSLWPDCANGFVISSDVWRREGAALAAGEPMLIQSGSRMERTKEPGFFYVALQATRRDDAGRIVEFETWPVLCGPPPPPRKEPDGTVVHDRYLTDHPLPGLEVRGDNCLARDPAVVREAARVSRAWAESPARALWIRNGRR